MLNYDIGNKVPFVLLSAQSSEILSNRTIKFQHCITSQSYCLKRPCDLVGLDKEPGFFDCAQCLFWQALYLYLVVRYVNPEDAIFFFCLNNWIFKLCPGTRRSFSSTSLLIVGEVSMNSLKTMQIFWGEGAGFNVLIPKRRKIRNYANFGCSVLHISFITVKWVF